MFLIAAFSSSLFPDHVNWTAILWMQRSPPIQILTPFWIEENTKNGLVFRPTQILSCLLCFGLQCLVAFHKQSTRLEWLISDKEQVLLNRNCWYHRTLDFKRFNLADLQLFLRSTCTLRQKKCQFYFVLFPISNISIPFRVFESNKLSFGWLYKSSNFPFDVEALESIQN